MERREEPNGVMVLSLAGEFGDLDLPKLSEEIDRLIREGHTRLVFDLQGLNYIDSSSLGYLVTVQKRVQELDGDLVIAQPSSFFERTIRTLGMDRILEVFPSGREAVNRFR